MDARGQATGVPFTEGRCCRVASACVDIDVDARAVKAVGRQAVVVPGNTVIRGYVTPDEAAVIAHMVKTAPREVYSNPGGGGLASAGLN